MKRDSRRRGDWYLGFPSGGKGVSFAFGGGNGFVGFRCFKKRYFRLGFPPARARGVYYCEALSHPVTS